MKRGMKKLFALFVFVVGLIMITNTKAEAADLVGSCGKGVNWYYDEETTTLTISGNGVMNDFTSSTVPWKDIRYNVTNIVIEKGVTRIGNYAFWSCKKVTTISMPEGITSIGKFAFAYMDRMTSIKFANTITSIEDYAFTHCEKVKEIDLPTRLQTIGKESFSNCYAVTKVTMHEGLQTIGYDAFYKCTALIGVSMPDTVTTIEWGAFSYCNNLEYARLSDNVEVLERTFDNCPKLYSVNIPKSIKTLNGTFSQCKNLKGIVLPEGLKTIKNYTFFNAGLTQLIVPSSVTYIGQWALYGIQGKVAYLNPNCEFYQDRDTVGSAGKTTVYCYENSTAEEMAYEYGLAVVYITGNNLWTDTMTKYNPFKDVAAGQYYYEPVLWAVDQGITAGTSATTFEPNTVCTRGQVVTFLWRANGKPEPTTTAHKFTDVYSGAYYYKAMLWAVENGITNGTSSTTFSPDNNCSRAEIVTFLHRAEGTPRPSIRTHTFRDVEASAFYYNAMLWAVENKITSGTSSTTFEPAKMCTRGEVVTFLYRAKNN